MAAENCTRPMLKGGRIDFRSSVAEHEGLVSPTRTNFDRTTIFSLEQETWLRDSLRDTIFHHQPRPFRRKRKKSSMSTRTKPRPVREVLEKKIRYFRRRASMSISRRAFLSLFSLARCPERLRPIDWDQLCAPPGQETQCTRTALNKTDR